MTLEAAMKAVRRGLTSVVYMDGCRVTVEPVAKANTEIRRALARCRCEKHFVRHDCPKHGVPA